MYELPKKKQHKGFTLIEVLVAISIMAILFTVGIANYRGVQRSKSLDAVKNQIIGDLRQAQGYAQASYKTCEGELQNIEFIIVNPNSYRIVCNCEDSDGIVDSEEIKQVSLNTNFTISSVGSVQFKPVGGGVEEVRVITITNSLTSEWLTILITTSGTIR